MRTCITVKLAEVDLTYKPKLSFFNQFKKFKVYCFEYYLGIFRFKPRQKRGQSLIQIFYRKQNILYSLSRFKRF